MTYKTSPPWKIQAHCLYYRTLPTISDQLNCLPPKKFNGIFSQIQDQEKNHYLVPTSIDNDIQLQKEEAVAETQGGRKPGPRSFLGLSVGTIFRFQSKVSKTVFCVFAFFQDGGCFRNRKSTLFFQADLMMAKSLASLTLSTLLQLISTWLSSP